MKITVPNVIITILAAGSFAFYLYVIFGLLIFRPGPPLAEVFAQPFREYITFNSNFIPFSQIFEQAERIITGSYWAALSRRNLFGNLVLLFPLGFYLPYFVRKLARLKYYIISVSAFVVVVEITQMLTRRGIIDVDDFILNLTGAVAGFLVFRHTPLRRLFEYRIY